MFTVTANVETTVEDYSMNIAEEINRHRTPRGGFTRKQLQALGIEWPPKSGWLKGLCQNGVSKERMERFIQESNQNPGRMQNSTTTLSSQWSLITDGGCLRNGLSTAVGAWAYVLRGSSITRSSGFVKSVYGLPVTNNKTEFIAAIEGLKLVPQGNSVQVHTDSSVLIGWIDRIAQSKGKPKLGKTTMDHNLIQDLCDQMHHKTVSHFWVKGHSGHEDNEWCDRQCSDLISGQ